MKALTICQPFAWAIIFGNKRVENRSWRTSYRGRLAIHAGQSLKWLKNDDSTLPDRSQHPPLAALIFGAVIGTVELIDVVPLAEVADDPFSFGPWCWLLSDPRALKTPMPLRGAQRIFEVPEDLFRVRP